MLLRFLHDNQGWQDRLAQLQTPSGDGGAAAGTDGTSGDGKKTEDERQKSGGEQS